MRSLNRREFMKGTVGAAATFAALPQRRVRGANDKIVIGVMGLGGRGMHPDHQSRNSKRGQAMQHMDIDQALSRLLNRTAQGKIKASQ